MKFSFLKHSETVLTISQELASSSGAEHLLVRHPVVLHKATQPNSCLSFRVKIMGKEPFLSQRVED